MDKYVAQSIAGKGSYGSAVVSRRKSDGLVCIIKNIALKEMSRKEIALVRQETKLLAQLRHPHIVSHLESFTKTKMGWTTLCIVMEYCERGDLEKWIAERRKLRRLPSESTALYYFAQLCMALEHVHAYRVVHRDLKPSNVFLAKGPTSGREVLKLGDFGISRVLSASGDLAATAIGTPCYMAPEMLEERPYDYKADVWSLGCLLYELGALKRAFEARSMPALVRLVLRTTAAPTLTNSSWSASLKALLAEMLRKKPSQRPEMPAIMRHARVKRAADAIVQEPTVVTRTKAPAEEQEPKPLRKPSMMLPVVPSMMLPGRGGAVQQRRRSALAAPAAPRVVQQPTGVDLEIKGQNLLARFEREEQQQKRKPPPAQPRRVAPRPPPRFAERAAAAERRSLARAEKARALRAVAHERRKAAAAAAALPMPPPSEPVVVPPAPPPLSSEERPPVPPSPARRRRWRTDEETSVKEQAVASLEAEEEVVSTSSSSASSSSSNKVEPAAMEPATPEEGEEVEPEGEVVIVAADEEQAVEQAEENNVLPESYRALGEGWWLKKDAISGKWFYVHATTGHSQWDPPNMEEAGEEEELLFDDADDDEVKVEEGEEERAVDHNQLEGITEEAEDEDEDEDEEEAPKERIPAKKLGAWLHSLEGKMGDLQLRLGELREAKRSSPRQEAAVKEEDDEEVVYRCEMPFAMPAQEAVQPPDEAGAPSDDDDNDRVAPDCSSPTPKEEDDEPLTPTQKRAQCRAVSQKNFRASIAEARQQAKDTTTSSLKVEVQAPTDPSLNEEQLREIALQDHFAKARAIAAAANEGNAEHRRRAPSAASTTSSPRRRVSLRDYLASQPDLTLKNKKLFQEPTAAPAPEHFLQHRASPRSQQQHPDVEALLQKLRATLEKQRSIYVRDDDDVQQPDVDEKNDEDEDENWQDARATLTEALHHSASP